MRRTRQAGQNSHAWGIYSYTSDRWGTEQADRYINGLFEAFDGIDSHQTHKFVNIR